MAVFDRLKNAWNAFSNSDQDRHERIFESSVEASPWRPDRTRFGSFNDRSIIAGIYTRMSVDFSSLDFKHVRVDVDDNYVETIKSTLNECLGLAANVDQRSQAFKQDLAYTLFEEGEIAIVPVFTSAAPDETGSYEILSIRVAKVVQYYPNKVKLSMYDERDGKRKELVLPKEFVAIVYNPFFKVMNEPNSTLQRIVKKLNLLDNVDEHASSGKLDLIIQVPYVVRSETRREQAKQRAQDIEMQLRQNSHGIAYTDGTEKVVQLNRPVENKLWDQIQGLLQILYGQLGLTPGIMDGTADEATMLNYLNRTIEPIAQAVVESMIASFFTKTARTQGQSIMYFKDPFKLIPLSQIAEIGDKFTRNEILSANEIRPKIGFRPSKDPKANELRNSNMPASTESATSETKEGVSQNGRDAEA